MLLSVQMVAAQGMSDQQVLQFIQKETKAGTSQSQIVTKLMQRGVKVDQIQRLRKQYADKIGPRGGRHHHGRPGGHHQMDMKGCCQDGKACQKDGKACECKDKKCQDMKGKKDKMKAQAE